MVFKRRKGSKPGEQPSVEDQFHSFTFLHQQYTTRNLSYDDNSLNAFLGIARQFESPIPFGDGSEVFWLVSSWGLPYTHCSNSTPIERETSFLNQLTWTHKFRDGHIVRCSDESRDEHQPPARATRIIKFPSWSWVGWKGEIDGMDLHADPHQKSIVSPYSPRARIRSIQSPGFHRSTDDHSQVSSTSS